MRVTRVSPLNFIADQLLRIKDLNDYMLDRSSFAYLDRCLGPHTVDRFASVKTRQLDRFLWQISQPWLRSCWCLHCLMDRGLQLSVSSNIPGSWCFAPHVFAWKVAYSALFVLYICVLRVWEVWFSTGRRTKQASSIHTHLGVWVQLCRGRGGQFSWLLQFLFCHLPLPDMPHPPTCEVFLECISWSEIIF